MVSKQPSGSLFSRHTDITVFHLLVCGSGFGRHIYGFDLCGQKVNKECKANLTPRSSSRPSVAGHSATRLRSTARLNVRRLLRKHSGVVKGKITCYLFVGFALVLFVMQMAISCTFIYQSLRHKQFQSRSGAPQVGSGLLSVAVVSCAPLVRQSQSPLQFGGTSSQRPFR